MTVVLYRSIQSKDVAIIRQIVLESWQYTYKNIFPWEFIQNFITSNYHPDSITRLIPAIEENKMFFDIAYNGDTGIGFCNIGLKPTPQLYRIYVRPAYIGKGVGATLLQRGEDFLRSKKITTYHCYVHKDNEIGKAFYARQGFFPKMEHHTQEEWYMEKALT